MKTSQLLSILAICLVLFSCNPAADKAQSGESIPPESIAAFVEALEKDFPGEIHSFMIRQHGEVVASAWWEPYREEDPHMLFSLSKSFTSTAIGMAIEEGLLSLDDPVVSFFPERLPATVSDNLASMRIRDLLKMNSGHQDDTMFRITGDSSWVRAYLALEVEHKPGTHFRYNTGASYILSAILQEASGQSLEAYLVPRLFEPLGITSHRWDVSPEGYNMGGFGLNLTTEAISLFGQFLLQEGEWEGRQLVSRDWIREATSFQTSNGSSPESDWEQGYGYQFWMCRPGMYRGDGAFGQYCIVFPEQDAVLAMTSGTNDMQGIMNLVWKYVLPGLNGEGPQADQAEPSLEETLVGLHISTQAGSASSALSDKYSGMDFLMEANPLGVGSMRFDFSSWPVRLEVEAGGSGAEILIGQDSWEKGFIHPPGGQESHIACSGAWDGPDTFVLKMVYTDGPSIQTHRFHFGESVLSWDSELNVSFGPRKQATVLGHLSD